MARPHTSRLISARAECERCGKTWNGANAQALAAQHYDKTHHVIWVDVTRRVEYGRASAPAAQTNLL